MPSSQRQSRYRALISTARHIYNTAKRDNKAICAATLSEANDMARAIYDKSCSDALNSVRYLDQPALIAKRAELKRLKKLIARMHALPPWDKAHPVNQIRLIELESQLERLTND